MATKGKRLDDDYYARFSVDEPTNRVSAQTKFTILTEFDKGAMIARELNENKDNC